MNSGVAFGWVLTGLINEHLRQWSDGTVEFRPDECGVCRALQDYFLTPRGRAEMDSFIRQVPKTGSPWVWQNEDRTVNWAHIEWRLTLPRRQ